MDTPWADISEHQMPVDGTYPHPVLAFRSNDGTYLDKAFARNHAWAKAAADSGRLELFIAYLVYYPNWADGVRALQQQVGTPHPRMAVMIDVESWPVNGVPTVSGDQSAGITAQRDAIAAWLGDPRRVIAYGNQGDLRALYPTRPADLQVVVAGYGQPVTGYPGQLAQQYTDAGPCAPFGVCDMNIARGMAPADVAAALGIGGDTSMSAQDVAQIMARIDQVVAWEDTNFKALQAQAEHNRDLLAGFLQAQIGGGTEAVKAALSAMPAQVVPASAALSPGAVIDAMAARLAPKAGS
jgi:hypothetical protein